MFHLRRLKCFESKYLYLNISREIRVTHPESQSKSAAELNSEHQKYHRCWDLLLTYIFMYNLICHSCYIMGFTSVCCARCDKFYTVFFRKHSGEQLAISWESEISSFLIHHSFGLWQSVQCVWFLSYHGNKLPIFIACFSQATLQQRHIVYVRLC